MKDIEVMRKELETAKRIREKGCDGFVAICDGISCDGDNCPFNVLCSNGRGDEVTAEYVRAFISSREAELAEMEKADEPHGGLTHEERVKKITTRPRGNWHARENGDFEWVPTETVPTLDDFALALIQGGYANGAVLVDKDGWTYPKGLYDLAAELKAESDRRRGI